MMPLTGTTNADHMRADLECFDFGLERKEVEQIENLLKR
jgi:diketogulonate reductase-like aldo/keto reductase